MFSLIFDTEYVDPQDILDTIIDGISIIKIDNSQKAYLEQLIEFFCKCRKYNMAMKTLNCINSFEMNFIQTLYNQPITIDQIIYIDQFINKKHVLNILKDELLQTINSAKDNANMLYSNMISISIIAECLGFACLALLFLSPLSYFFLIGSALIGLGLITFAIGSIIQYFRQVDYQQDIARMEYVKLC